MYQIGDDEVFLEWRPEAGSVLYKAIQEKIVAEAHRDALGSVLEDLQERRRTTQEMIGAVDWRTGDIETVGALHGQLPVIDAMIATARREVDAAQNELRLKVKAVDTAAANLRTALGNVNTFENLKTGVPALFTEADEQRLNDYRQQLAVLAGATLAA